MARIEVTAAGDDSYDVTIDDGISTSHHVVTVPPNDHRQVAGGVDGETLVAATVRFLLDREPKESIMARFDLAVVTRYFPEFPERIGDYLP